MMNFSSLREKVVAAARQVTALDAAELGEVFSSILNKAAMMGLVFSAIFVLWVGQCLMRPYKVMRINNINVISTDSVVEGDVSLPVVEAGEYLEYVLDYCKEKEYEFAQAQVQNSFRDGVIYNVPIESGPLPSGCQKVLFILHVPAIPEGRYHLEMLRTYSVNPLRTIGVRGISNDFKVSTQRRMEQMLKQQLPKVIPKVLPQIPELR